MGLIKSIKSNPLFSFGLFVGTLTHILTHVFRKLYTTTFPIIRTEFNLSITELGIIAAIPFLCQTIISIPAGLLSDKFGSKKMLFVSILFCFTGAIIAAYANSPIILIIAASLFFMNTTIYHPASYSYTTKLFTKKDRTKALGIHGAGGTLGVAFGPLSLSILTGVFLLSWRNVYLFWSIPVFLSLFLVYKLPSIDIPNKDNIDISESSTNEPTKFLSRNLIIFLSFYAIHIFAVNMIDTFMPIYLVDSIKLNIEQMGLVITGVTISGIISAPLGGYIATKVGLKRWYIISIVMAMTILFLAFILNNAILFIILYLTYGFNSTLGMAARSSLMADLTPSKSRGIGYALLFMPGAVAGVIAPVIAASIINIFGMQYLFFIAIGVMLGGVIFFLLGFK